MNQKCREIMTHQNVFVACFVVHNLIRKQRITGDLFIQYDTSPLIFY